MPDENAYSYSTPYSTEGRMFVTCGRCGAVVPDETEARQQHADTHAEPNVEIGQRDA